MKPVINFRYCWWCLWPAIDADEAGDVCGLGRRSESTRSADHQQACPRYGRSRYKRFLLHSLTFTL